MPAVLSVTTKGVLKYRARIHISNIGGRLRMKICEGACVSYTTLKVVYSLYCDVHWTFVHVCENSISFFVCEIEVKLFFPGLTYFIGFWGVLRKQEGVQ